MKTVSSLMIALFFLLLAAVSGASAADAPSQSIVAPSGAELFTIIGTGSKLEIVSKLDGTALKMTAEGNAVDKRRYSVYGKEYVVKASGGGGFKLTLPDGTLLWKVKLKEGKLKVSNNEENKNPFEIKKKSDAKIVVETETDTLGVVRWDAEKMQAVVRNVDGEDILTGSFSRFSSLFGMLVIQAVPSDQRTIIITELALRGL